jgi:chromosome segregation ATPase
MSKRKMKGIAERAMIGMLFLSLLSFCTVTTAAGSGRQASQSPASATTPTDERVHRLELAIHDLLVELEHARSVLAIKVKANDELTAKAEDQARLISNLERQVMTLQAALEEAKQAEALDAKAIASFQKSVDEYKGKVGKLEDRIISLNRRWKWSAGIGFVAGVLLTAIFTRD